jgi:glutamate-1-semialdehyde 2,1-aminomutase
VWETLENRTAQLAIGIAEAARKAGVPVWQNRVGTMFATFFTDTPVTHWPSAKASNTKRFGKFFQGMLEGGVYLAPSQFEAGFMSTTHGEAEIQATIQAAEEAFQQC